MTKAQQRQIIKEKYNGRCAYTGKDLGTDWQIDHVHPKNLNIRLNDKIEEHDDLKNLLPACRIVNHYKRGFNLEGFRTYMFFFHKRLSTLPKTTKSEKTKTRIDYMKKVAELFEITPEKRFSGKFYFETL